jgi:DNA-binding transcriptional regulator/RsmH inhibitor MraZ
MMMNSRRVAAALICACGFVYAACGASADDRIVESCQRYVSELSTVDHVTAGLDQLAASARDAARARRTLIASLEEVASDNAQRERLAPVIAELDRTVQILERLRVAARNEDPEVWSPPLADYNDAAEREEEAFKQADLRSCLIPDEKLD